MDCMLTLSLSANTIVRKNARTKLRASVASKKRARTAERVPPVTVTSSHGKRNRKMRHGDAPRICSTRNPSASKNSGPTGSAERYRSSLSPASKISSAKRFASMMPMTWRCSSTTGNARNLYSTKNSQASRTVAVAGTATTRGTMICRTDVSSDAVSRRRVGTTPTRRFCSSTA